MKEYVKPEIEVVDFATENITVMGNGTSGGPEILPNSLD